MVIHAMAGRLAAAAVVVLAFAGCANDASVVPHVAPPSVVMPDPADFLTEEELERFGYEGDGMTIEMADLTTAVTQEFGSSEGFSGFEWSRTTATMTLWWHGDLPAALEEQLSAFGPSVRVAQAVNPPRELRDAVARIMTPGAVPGVFVSGAGASIDCARLNVMAEAADAPMSETDMAAAIERVAGFPVSLEVGHVVPISAIDEP